MSERRLVRRIRAVAVAAVGALVATLLVASGAQAATAFPYPFRNGAISGTVSIPGDVPREQLADVTVVVMTTFYDRYGTTYQSNVDPATGEYTVTDVPAGLYRVAFDVAPGVNLVSDYYGGLENRYSTVVEVFNDTTTTDIDVTLRRGASVFGMVTLPPGMSRDWYQYVDVEIFNRTLSPGIIYSPPISSTTGEFSVTGVLPGTYSVGFRIEYVEDPSTGDSHLAPLREQYYDHVPLSADATLITLGVGDSRRTDASLESTLFTDVSADPRSPSFTVFADEIAWLSSKGIVRGYSNGDGFMSYRPYSPVLRDQMAAFLYRLEGSPAFTPPARSPFLDVPTSYVFYKEITWLYARGITNGWDVPGGKEYRPLEPIKRDQMAAFLYRSAGSPWISVGWDTGFRDVGMDRWNRNVFMFPIAWMKQSGISTGWAVPGGAEYRPYQNVLRDQMAAFLYRYTESRRS